MPALPTKGAWFRGVLIAIVTIAAVNRLRQRSAAVAQFFG